MPQNSFFRISVKMIPVSSYLKPQLPFPRQNNFPPRHTSGSKKFSPPPNGPMTSDWQSNHSCFPPGVSTVFWASRTGSICLSKPQLSCSSSTQGQKQRTREVESPEGVYSSSSSFPSHLSICFSRLFSSDNAVVRVWPGSVSPRRKQAYCHWEGQLHDQCPPPTSRLGERIRKLKRAGNGMDGCRRRIFKYGGPK